jgi:hypothetical protein
MKEFLRSKNIKVPEFARRALLEDNSCRGKKKKVPDTERYPKLPETDEAWDRECTVEDILKIIDKYLTRNSKDREITGNKQIRHQLALRYFS